MLDIEPIHPYDVYDAVVANKAVIERGSIKMCLPVDGLEGGNMVTRFENRILEIDGKLYHETTGVPFKSKSFNFEHLERLPSNV
jgi:hypothetical protein